MTKQDEVQSLLFFFSLPPEEQAKRVPKRMKAVHCVVDSGKGEIWTIRPLFFLASHFTDLVGPEGATSTSETLLLLKGLHGLFALMIESARSYPFLFDSTQEDAPEAAQLDGLGLGSLWIAVRYLSQQILNYRVQGTERLEFSLDYFTSTYAEEVDEAKCKSRTF